MHKALERGGNVAMKFISHGVWLWRLNDAMVAVPIDILNVARCP